MKIAVLSNLDKELSPITEGGTELFTYLLVQELANRKDITSIDVFGLGKNFFESSKVTFHAILPKLSIEFINKNEFLSDLYKTRSDFITQFQTVLGILLYRELIKGNYDIIHDNSLSPSFNALSSLIKTPIISTLHTNFNSPSIVIPESLGLLSSQNINHYFVPISKFQEKMIRERKLDLNISNNIYNGLDLSKYACSLDTPQDAPGLWVGRISRKHNKGLREAIIASDKTKKNLVVIRALEDIPFYDETIKPVLNSRIQIIPQPENTMKKNEFYMNGSYLLYPIMWEEPFPNVVLESLASGTPVIAFAKGSLPESVIDGKTGFIVNPSADDIRGDWIIKRTGIDGICEAIERTCSMPKEKYVQMRKNCRTHIEENFTIEKTATGYEKLYINAIQNSKKVVDNS